MTDLSPYEIGKKISKIFMPFASERREKIINNRGRFVHYTSAENAMRIIKSSELWMRDARCMQDYSEVAHGYERLREYFAQDTNRKSFYGSLNACADSIAEEAITLFDQWWEHLQFNTYISCLSEHGGEDEDVYGRLSMWRAFGPGAPGAALVFNIPLEKPLEPLAVFLSPVAYFKSVSEEMARVIQNIHDNREFLCGIPRGVLVRSIFITLVMAAVSLKHAAFLEEREWRAIHLPSIFPSRVVRPGNEIIRGVPQIVYKIPLKDFIEDKIEGIALPKILDRVIIGPSNYPTSMAAAFSAALTEVGMENAASKVFVSNIPIRN